MRNENPIKNHIFCALKAFIELELLRFNRIISHWYELKSRNVIPLVKKIDPIVFTVPLRQGKTHSITEDELTDWQKNYPAIDVRQEIRQLIAWNQANPDRQKTERGINRHIQGWLAHTQKNKPQDSRDSFSPSLSNWDHNMVVMKAVLEEDDEIE